MDKPHNSSAGTIYNRNVMEEERAFQERLRLKKKVSEVEFGGYNVPSFESDIFSQINSGISENELSKSTLKPSNTSETSLSKGKNVIQKAYRDDVSSADYSDNADNPYLQELESIKPEINSGVNTSTANSQMPKSAISIVGKESSNIKIADERNIASSSIRSQSIENKLYGLGNKGMRTTRMVVTGVTRTYMRNEDNSGRGLAEIYDKGGETALHNKIAVAKTAVVLTGSKPLIAGLAVSSIAKRALHNQMKNSYANKYSRIEYNKALAQMNNILGKNGIEGLESIDNEKIDSILKNLKTSGLSKEMQSEVSSTLNGAKLWQNNLDLDVAYKNANKVLKSHGMRTLEGLRGSELSIAASNMYRKLKRSGASQDVLDSVERLRDIGNAQTFEKTFKQKFRKKMRNLKNITRSIMRYMRQTDAGKGTAISIALTALTYRALKHALRTAQSVAKLADKLSKKALLAALNRKEKAINDIKNMSTEALRNRATAREVEAKQAKLIKQRDKLQARVEKEKAKAKKAENIKSKIKDPFGIKARYAAFNKRISDKIGKKIFGEKGYDVVQRISERVFSLPARFINFVKSIMRKLVALLAGFALLVCGFVIIIDCIAAIVASFDISGDSNYIKCMKYIKGLYYDDISTIAGTGQHNGKIDYLDGYGCNKVSFVDIKSDDKYTEEYADTDEEFNHIASSNIGEIMCMTYIHFKQEYVEGDEATDGDANPEDADIDGSDVIDVFNNAKYKELKEYIRGLWFGSHEITIYQSQRKAVYTTYYYDDLFDCKLRNNRNITVVQTSSTGNASSSVVFAWRFFIDKGFSPEATAGILGNLQAESGLDPNIRQGPNASGAGYGICQWTRYVNGTESGAQWQAVVDWCNANGFDAETLEGQLNYLVDGGYITSELSAYSGLSTCWVYNAPYNHNNYSWEDRGGGYYGPAGTTSDAWCWWPEEVTLDEFMTMDDVELATEIYERTCERAGLPNMGARKQYALDFYGMLKNLGDYIWPVNCTTFTCPFGWRYPYDYPSASKNHKGVDQGAGMNDPIYAVADGTVTANAWNNATGNYVKYLTNEGYEITQMHMSSPGIVSVGSSVKQGDVIGYAGSTGASTGVHCHMNVYNTNDGKYYNALYALYGGSYDCVTLPDGTQTALQYTGGGQNSWAYLAGTEPLTYYSYSESTGMFYDIDGNGYGYPGRVH